MTVPRPEPPLRGSPKLLTHRNFRDRKCLLLFYTTKFWDNLLGSHR